MFNDYSIIQYSKDCEVRAGYELLLRRLHDGQRNGRRIENLVLAGYRYGLLCFTEKGKALMGCCIRKGCTEKIILVDNDSEVIIPVKQILKIRAIKLNENAIHF